MDAPKAKPPARTELRAPTRPRGEADAWRILGVPAPPSGDSTVSIEAIQAQALAHTARILAGWLLPNPESRAHLVVYDLHVWESSELYELWWSFTQTHADKFSDAQDAWEFRIRGTDKEALDAMLALVMMFGWGVAGCDALSVRRLLLDHDGTVRLWGGGCEDRSTIERTLSK